MSAPAPVNRERLFELMADGATEGWGEANTREVEALLRENPDVDPELFELTVAAVDLALSPEPQEPIPTMLRGRLEADASRFLSDRKAGREPSSQARREEEPEPSPERRVIRLTALAGWSLAAGLALVVLAGGERGATRLPWVSPPTPLAPVDARAELVSQAGDVMTLSWQATGDAAGPTASGDVMWSPTLQRGFMRFRGLAANDPRVSQYQLWIFDAVRDERYPIDGGVFDVPAGADEVVVPIRARLPVSRPVLFAITVEDPGGVVVSSRERLPLLAKAGT